MQRMDDTIFREQRFLVEYVFYILNYSLLMRQ